MFIQEKDKYRHDIGITWCIYFHLHNIIFRGHFYSSNNEKKAKKSTTHCGIEKMTQPPYQLEKIIKNEKKKIWFKFVRSDKK